MARRSFRSLVVALLLAAAPAPVAAGDAGKERLGKLFSEPASSVAESTVRVTCDHKPAALGLVVAADGLIVTKGSELRGEITCVLSDGTAYDAKYVGYHKATDLALLRIDTKGLKPVAFASRTAAEVGNWVASVDHNADPVAVGVVSAGPRKLHGTEAMPRNSNKGFLGIGLADPEAGEGVMVSDLLPGGAAKVAGLAVEDVICEIAGKPVKDRSALAELLEYYRPGDSVTVRVRRGDKQLSFKVTLGDRAKVEKNGVSRNDVQNAMGGSLSARRTGFPSVIQHDGHIKPSDCGGPLVDLDGRVVGMNIARAGRVETWALPGDVVTTAVTELKAGKHPAP